MSKNKNPLTQKSSGATTNIILTVIVVIVAIAVIGGVLLFNRGGGSGGDSGGQTVAADVLRKPDSNLLSEAPDGKVTVVEFLDYQCPACHQYYDNLTKKVEQDYQGKITFVARNYPLDMHKLAQPAARAAEAAALQGKFKEMYHALYDNYSSWAGSGEQLSSDVNKANAEFDKYARQIGLDMDKFHQDLNSPQVQKKIDADVADGEKAGVSGTPTIFINGKQFQPDVQTFGELEQEFRKQIDQELAK
ncbi:DsbA family protein [Saccharopolyspora griseoalba]|uniref:DsbA family protein n=1 Tax=Saccharopolyspora griseoalba TaxID=1431848 RepID=A0ABW2LT92_9PSEU